MSDSLYITPTLTPLNPLSGRAIGSEDVQQLFNSGNAPFDPLVGLFNGVPITKSAQAQLHESVDLGEMLGTSLAGSTRAWHGTPHTFAPEPAAPLGAFRDAAIGSGEGAQAYGWGHYVAGRRGIAEGYRDRLVSGAKHVIYHDDSPLTSDPEGDSAESIAHYYLLKHAGLEEHTPYTIARAMDEIRDYTNNGFKGGYDQNGWNENLRVPTPPTFAHAADWIEENRDKLKVKENSGNLYHVDILPEEHELLDWDRPLAQQSEEVKKKLISSKLLDEKDFDPKYSTFTGENLYHDYIEHYGSQPAASAALHEAGVPGLRYLDASSRHLPSDDPAATRNYVIFHPSNLRVVGRNGEMLQLEQVEHDPFGGGE